MQRSAKSTRGPGRTNVDSVGLRFGRLLESPDLKRPGLNFYPLRHTFETIAGKARDQVAVDAIIGREANDTASRYRARIGDGRLRAAMDYVRRCLFGLG